MSRMPPTYKSPSYDPPKPRTKSQLHNPRWDLGAVDRTGVSTVQMKAMASVGSQNATLPGTLPTSPSHPLDKATRDYFEPRFGFDFSTIKIHTDCEAVRLAARLDARAFTFGPHIAFGQGEYEPGTEEGRRLIAHELTHVVQHDGGMEATRMTMSQPGDRFEREADAVAPRVVGGGSAALRIGTGGAVPSVQRKDKPTVVTVGDLPELDPGAAF